MASADQTFSLESPGPRHGRQIFARPLSGYESLYGTKVRQIKNWVKEGRDAQPVDLPPLDDPAAMPAWWVRRFDRAVPAKILEAAKAPKLPAPPIAPPQPADPEPKAKKPPLPPEAPRNIVTDFESLEGLDLAGSIARTRKTLAVLQRDYETALLDENASDSTLTLRAARVDKCMERLRKMEGTLDDLRKSREELIDRAAAADDLRRVHSAMATSLESLLVGKFGLERTAARLGIDEWFGTLRQSRFFANSQPTAA